MVVQRSSRADDPDSFANVIVPIDEFEHWTEQARKGGRGRARAEKFSSIFDAVVDQFTSLDSATLAELEDLVDETQGVLDDIWKAELYETDRYPVARMKHLMEVISGAVLRRMQSILRTAGVWTGRPRQSSTRSKPPFASPSAGAPPCASSQAPFGRDTTSIRGMTLTTPTGACRHFRPDWRYHSHTCHSRGASAHPHRRRSDGTARRRML